MTRYFFVVLVMGLLGIAIVVKAAVIMFAERQYWQDVADRFVKENFIHPVQRSQASACFQSEQIQRRFPRTGI